MFNTKYYIKYNNKYTTFICNNTIFLVFFLNEILFLHVF